jgi:hypothetical protein
MMSSDMRRVERSVYLFHAAKPVGFPRRSFVMNIRRCLFAMVVLCLAGLSHAGEREPSGVPKVALANVPAGGEAVVAKTDAAGVIHLLYDVPAGPQYASSTDGGKTWNRPVAIVDRASQQTGLEFDVWDMAVGKGGRVHVALGTNAWKLKLPQSEWGYFYASLAPGAKAFSKLRNINSKPSEGFSLAADEKGNVTATWMADKLYANISRDEGKTFAHYVEIDASYNPCNCCTTSSTYAADGRVAILYREETDNERDMYLVLWDQAKNKTSRTRVSATPWKIDACPMTYYTVNRAKQGFVAAWPTKDSIYFARLDGQGEPLAPAEIKTPGNPGMRSGIVALPSSSGSTLVAWKKENRLGWQLYDEKGEPVGQSGSAKSAGKGVAAVVDKNGDFLLVQ